VALHVARAFVADLGGALWVVLQVARAFVADLVTLSSTRQEKLELYVNV